MGKKTIGDSVEHRKLETIQSSEAEIPHSSMITHLQFRRFAGCPMCNLHIHSFVQRNNELLAHGVQEISVFHSSKKAMLKHHASAPFALIADPGKSLYREFGVEASLFSVLHPGSWGPMIKGIFQHGVSPPAFGENPLGLPADFLIDRSGKIVNLKYGSHAYDQWTVDEVIELAKKAHEA